MLSLYPAAVTASRIAASVADPEATRREIPPGTSSTVAVSTPSTALTAFSTLALQLPQVKPSKENPIPGAVSGACAVSVEQQPHPVEEAEVTGSSVRDGVCMSVPFAAEDSMVLWLNGCKEEIT